MSLIFTRFALSACSLLLLSVLDVNHGCNQKKYIVSPCVHCMFCILNICDKCFTSYLRISAVTNIILSSLLKDQLGHQWVWKQHQIPVFTPKWVINTNFFSPCSFDLCESTSCYVNASMGWVRVTTSQLNSSSDRCDLDLGGHRNRKCSQSWQDPMGPT